MPYTKVGTCEVLGEELDIDVSDVGRFVLTTQGGRSAGSGASLDEAKRNARTQLAKQRTEVAVPFKFKDGTAGVAKRRHASTSKVLVVLDSGEKDEVGISDTVFRPETPDAVVEEYQAALRKIAALQRRTREIDHEWAFTLGRTVDQAIDEAVSAEEVSS